MTEKSLLPGPQKQVEIAARPQTNGGAAPQLSPPGDLEEKLSRPVSSLKLKSLPEFSRNRVLNHLRNISIKTLGDLVRLNEKELRTTNYLKGGKTREAVKAELEEMGLTLGMFSKPYGPEPKPLSAEAVQRNLALRVERLRFDKRVTRSLSGAGVDFVHQLVLRSEGELINLPYMGEKNMQRIAEVLAEHGLKLGMCLGQDMLVEVQSRIDRSISDSAACSVAVPVQVPELSDMQIANLAKSVNHMQIEQGHLQFLEKINIRYVYQLAQKTEDGLLKQKKFGKRAVREIKEILSELGLSLGMQLDRKMLAKIKKMVPKAPKAKAPKAKASKDIPKPEKVKLPSPKAIDAGRKVMVEGMPKAYATVNNALVVRTNLSKDELQELLDLAMKIEPYKEVLSKFLDALGQDKKITLGRK